MIILFLNNGKPIVYVDKNCYVVHIISADVNDMSDVCICEMLWLLTLIMFYVILVN